MTRTIAYIKVIAMLLVSGLLLPSCKDDTTFAAENKTMIDTMFLNRKIIIRDEIDSLCSVKNERFYQEAVDSIMEARIAEIEIRLQSLKANSTIQ